MAGRTHVNRIGLAALGAVLSAVALLVGPLGGDAAAATTTTVSRVPRPDHVVIVIDENHAEQNIIGNADAPYINSLAGQSVNFTDFFAETHPSQPNYLALFSGSTQGVTDDGCPHTFTGANLGSELLAAGDSFTGYSEDLPSVGYTGCGSGEYARKHNPWVNFSNIPSADNQPFSAFPSDYSQLPAVSFVIPNLDDDMHDGTIAQGDSWLQNNLSGYITWAKTHNSLFLLTFDEDDGSEANQIPTIIAGGGITPGRYAEQINHYNVLRTLEDGFGLPTVGASATASPILDIWAPPSGDQPPTAKFTASCPTLTCTFDASGSSDPDGAISSYAWTFGDGSTGSGATTNHVYSGGGTRSVTLTVTDNAGLSTSTTQVVAPTAPAGSVLLSDGFSRTVSNGWGNADTGGPWTTSGTAANYSVSNGTGHMTVPAPGTVDTALANNVNTLNANILVDITTDKIGTGNGTVITLLAHHTTNGDYRLRLRLLPGGTAHLAWSRVVSGHETVVHEIVVPNLTYTTTTALSLRFQITTTGATTTLAAKAWNTTTTEPATWQLDDTDTTPTLQTAGTLGLQTELSTNSTNAPTTISYDNLTATDPTAPGNSTPVAVIHSSCSQLTCQFDGSASSDSGATITTYAWSFGDGASGTGASVTHAFVSAGSYPVTLTVTDGQGHSATANATVSATAPPVNHPPVAAFTWACTGLSCTVDGSSSSDPDDITPDQWAWEYGDGSTATGVTPTAHVYAAAGTYSVTLTVTDEDDATDTVTHAITVSAGTSTSLLSDGFSRTVSNGWGNADTGGPWTTSGTAANYSVSNGTGHMTVPAPGTVDTALANNVNTLNANILVDITTDKIGTGNGTVITLLAHHTTNGDYRLRLRLLPGGTAHLAWSRVVSGHETVVHEIVVPNLTYTTTTALRLRFQITTTGATTTLAAKAWNTTTTEPATWQLDDTDTTPTLQTAGTLGLQTELSTNSTNAPTTISYDNLTATAP